MVNVRIRNDLAQHIPGLRRYARFLTRCPERGDDLVQECLARALRAADTFRPDAPIRPWLYQILRNLHHSERRRDSVRSAFAAGHFEDECVAPVQYGYLELKNVLDAVARLPEPQRDAICLVALEDLTYAEAAEILEIPVGTLMSRLARGREALRVLMESDSPSKLNVVGGRDHGR